MAQPNDLTPLISQPPSAGDASVAMAMAASFTRTDSLAKLATQRPSAPMRLSTFSEKARTAGASSSENSPASMAASGSRAREVPLHWKKKAMAVDGQAVAKAKVAAARSRSPPPRPP